MKNTKIDVFTPPGVQMKLFARLGTIPRQATPGVAAKIAQIWLVRNNCPESEIESLDGQMEKIMVAAVMAERARKPRVSWDRQIEEDAQSSKLDELYERLQSENEGQPGIPLDEFLDHKKLS